MNNLLPIQLERVVNISHKNEVFINKSFKVEKYFFKPVKIEIESCVAIMTKPEYFFYSEDGVIAIEDSYIRDCHMIYVRDIIKMSPQEQMVDVGALRVLEILAKYNIDYENLKGLL